MLHTHAIFFSQFCSFLLRRATVSHIRRRALLVKEPHIIINEDNKAEQDVWAPAFERAEALASDSHQSKLYFSKALLASFQLLFEEASFLSHTCSRKELFA